MSSKAAQSSMGPPNSGPQHPQPTTGHSSLPSPHASLNPHAPHSAHLAPHSHGPHGSATGPASSPMGLVGLGSPSMSSQHSLGSQSPPNHPLAPLAPPPMGNPCLPGEYPPVSTSSIPHSGHASHHSVISQQRGPLPSLHQPQLSSLGQLPSGHLSAGQSGSGDIGGQMPPPAAPPSSGHPHTPRADRLTPPPPPLASLGVGQMQMVSTGIGIVNQSVMSVLPAPPQQVSPPPPVATPTKPSPDYELANYHHALFDYDPARIYTVSETCLLYNKLPNAERDTLSDTLNADARITVLLCSNANGTHKFRPLVINCRRDGEDFNENRDKLPVSYASQRSSFLTGNIFQQWIWELERRVEYPCVLLLDTSPAHVSVSVQSDKIKLLFLQNSLRQLQPLNQGAITEFKARYKAEMITHTERQLSSAQGNQGSNGVRAALPTPDVVVPFLDALYILSDAWSSLARDTLLESWTKSQLLPVRIYTGRRDIEEEAIHELSQAIKASKLCCAPGDRGGSDRSGASGGSGGSAAASPADGIEPNRREVEEYLHLDDTFPTSYSFSEEAFESSSATQGYSSEAMDAALMQYYHLRRSRQLTPEEILAMLDKMEQFFTHQALISSTDILAIHSLRSKTYKIASNYYPPSASAVGSTPTVVTPPTPLSSGGTHPGSQYTPPLLAGPPLLAPAVPVSHQQSPFPSTSY
ncbi:hypothetical protein BIW11_03497 [Tropilaelaps mercedesae]|uniref:DDE-1 domain-containing protein n=1 Tax=Tropilaelaps mercedesae TaxID=418985 RepID=A0A1V9XK17_9ACAR|nr:hypothetical protein BIW11_03497 [Tropilaelaps mercedesae]